MLLWAATDCDWRFFSLLTFCFTCLSHRVSHSFCLFFFFKKKNRDDQFQAEYDRSEQLKHWCETQASGLLRSAEADPKSITNGSAEGHQEPTRSTHRRIIYMLEMWTDSFVAQVLLQKDEVPDDGRSIWKWKRCGCSTRQNKTFQRSTKSPAMKTRLMDTMSES